MKVKIKKYIDLKSTNSIAKDFYAYLIELAWFKFVIFIIMFYLLSNTLFAYLYFLDIENINQAQSFSDAYFFSTQTMATIGYGVLNPKGNYLNWIVVLQSAYSFITMAAMTGIVFAKISRPKSKVLFSDRLVISNFNGKKCLSLRVANTRGNNILEARIKLSILAKEITLEGHEIRKIYDLDLVRHQTSFFRLSWTIFHEINEQSPFYNINLEQTNIFRITAILAGHDETYSSTIYARKDYYIKDISQDQYFEDIMFEDTNNVVYLDYSKFNKLKD